MSGFDFSKASEDFRRRNPQFFANGRETQRNGSFRGGMPLSHDDVPHKPYPPLESHGMQSGAKMNKTEAQFLREWLAPKARGAECLIIPQPTRFFRLTGGGTYTPDFLVIHPRGVTAYEVKGGYRGAGWEQGYERYKRAAFEWSRPWLGFVMATWQSKINNWKIEIWEG